MKKLSLLVLVFALLGVITANAQIITTDPAVLQESSENVVIYYHADQGNKGLINQPSSDPIYAHTGVITNLSTNSTDWKHAPTWSKNEDKYKMEYVSANLWKLTIGNIRTFYGLTDGEIVKQLAFVFRNSTGSKVGKTTGDGDIFVDVVDDGLQVSLSCNLEGVLIKEGNTDVKFTVASTQNAALALYINDTPLATVNNNKTLTATYSFTQTGTYTVRGTATINELTVSDELILTYPKASDAQTYPGGVPQMGCVRNADGTVNFCIAAPGKSSAILVGSWEDYKVRDENTMHYQDYNGYRYFWTTVSGLNATDMYMYYFMIDGTSVGDPYAKLILDPSNDKYISAEVYPNLPEYPYAKISASNVPLAVYQENINNYNWKVTDFHGVAPSNLLIYELLVRDFTGTEGKALGDGTIRGAMTKLNYLKELGVNAIELLPINEFQGNISWGYNPNFYFAPDKAYGTPDDYKAFIDACHEMGIAVILDMVFNQTDWLHPWYQLYPTGSNPFYNATAPHAYSVLNDWNQGHPLVQKQFQDCLKYWIREYKVDGFRFDLVKGLGDNSSYANSGDAATNAYNASRIARMKSLHAAIKEVKEDAYFINENLAGADEENQMAEDGELNWANVNTQGMQYAMGYSSNSNLRRFYAPLDSRLWGSTVSYLESHDEQRLAYQQNIYGATGVKGNLKNSMARIGSAAAQMILAPGAHMIWQFSELGNYDNTKNATGGNNVDPKTVRWSLFDNATRHGLYTSYAELQSIRNANPELFAQSASFTDQCAESNWSNGRFIYASAGGKELICVINPNIDVDKTLTVSFKSQNNDDYQILSKSYNTNPTFNAAASAVSVPANSYVVIANKSVVGVKDVVADADDNVSVYAADGRITISGNYRRSAIYDMAGQLCPSSGLNPGVYMVRVDNKTFKVLVK